MMATRELFSSSIVALGSFNPGILSADWLERQNLIGKEDAESAREKDSTAVSRRVAQVETDSFLLQVLEQRLSISSTGPTITVIKDLASGILSLLPHTPITALGINFEAHYKLQTTELYHKVGDTLAPKEIWKCAFGDDNLAFGLQDLQIRIDPAKRGEKLTNGDHRRLTVQPSVRVPNGVYFMINNHFDVSSRVTAAVTSSADIAAQLVVEMWDSTFDTAPKTMESLISEVEKT